MKMTSIEYKEFESLPAEWSLERLSLESLSLLVGKNASGKSRTINVIHALATMLNGSHKPDYKSGKWLATFSDGKTQISYEIHLEKRRVTREVLTIDGKTLLKRGPNGIGTIFTEKIKDDLEFQTPDTEVAAFVRQDSIQHPFLGDLRSWADSVFLYHFGSSLGKQNMAVFIEGDQPQPINNKDEHSAVAIFKTALKKYGRRFVDLVCKDMNEIGYRISDVGIDSPTAVEFASPAGAVMGIWAQEDDLSCRTEQVLMSQGMFRALSLLGQLNFSYLEGLPSLVLIDDIGEGLDFDRSTKLIQLLVEKAQKSSVQFILTTNDRFVMNSVPLTCWSIMQRTRGKVRHINKTNSSESFDDFEFSGLNNFDFFSKNLFAADSEGPLDKK